MTLSKPIVVLVHGAWHVPASYSKFVAALRSAGYTVVVPQLPSTNDTNAGEGELTTDTAQVRSCVEGLVQVGQTVIAVLHSYGGHVGTNALYGLSVEGRSRQGLTGGISKLIYVSAFILPED